MLPYKCKYFYKLLENYSSIRNTLFRKISFIIYYFNISKLTIYNKHGNIPNYIMIALDKVNLKS